MYILILYKNPNYLNWKSKQKKKKKVNPPPRGEKEQFFNLKQKPAQ